MTGLHPLLACTTILAALAVATPRPAASEPVWPTTHWAAQSPAQAGMDAAILQTLAQKAGGHGFIARGGREVFHWGDPSRNIDIASAAKPFYTHLLIKAVEDHKIPGFDEPMANWEPRLNTINEAADHPDRLITWRQAAFQTTGYGLQEAPGTAFAYNDWQMALFFDTLLLKAYGTSYETIDDDVFHPTLTDPIQCEDNPTMLAFGTGDRPGRIAISTRDFARFGLLYLRHGNWNGKQLISKEHARMIATSPLPGHFPRAGFEAAEMIPGQRSIGSRQIPDNQTDHMGSYSWLWWVNGTDRDGIRHWPDAPVDTYGAFGHGGMRAMVVIPEYDLIIAWNDTRIEGRDAENQTLTLLLQSLTTP